MISGPDVEQPLRLPHEEPGSRTPERAVPAPRLQGVGGVHSPCVTASPGVEILRMPYKGWLFDGQDLQHGSDAAVVLACGDLTLDLACNLETQAGQLLPDDVQVH